MQVHGSRRLGRTAVLAACLSLVLAACAGDDAPEDEPDAQASEGSPEAQAEDDDAADDGDRLAVVATTSILGDIAQSLVGDDGDVTVLMAPGVDPHGYQPSAADAALLREADLVIANGLLLEESLVAALEAAEEDGARVLELAEHLDPIEFDWDGPGHAHGDDDLGHDDDDGHGHDDDDGHGHDDDDGHAHDDDDGHAHDDDDGHAHDDDDGHAHDDDDGHAHDDDDGHAHDDDDGHAHGPEDPHVWFDPIRMVDGVDLIAAELSAVWDSIDADEWQARADTYNEELLAVHEEIEGLFADIPEDRRQLITNHDALGYLAHRYDLQVVGTVIPGSSTQAEADARAFAELIETVEAAGVNVIFAENTDSTVLADQLASEVVGRGDLEVQVVGIYTDALGEDGSGAETYLGLLRTTAQLIADALG